MARSTFFRDAFTTLEGLGRIFLLGGSSDVLVRGFEHPSQNSEGSHDILPIYSDVDKFPSFSEEVSIELVIILGIYQILK